MPEVRPFGEVAIRAMELRGIDPNISPSKAWDQARIEIISYNKVCPRSAFLALCEEGYLIGIEPGRYSTNELRENKDHAILAVTHINFNAEDFSNYKRIWDNLGIKTSHQGHIDVIYGLFIGGYLNMKLIEPQKIQ